MRNIILIGMPGAGKSTVGVILAKSTNRQFVDADLLIQRQTGRLLQTIIDTDGIDAFLKTEEEVLCGISCTDGVIATGGSAVYSETAMRHLADGGTVVYLKLPIAALRQRINNMSTRGIAMRPGETLDSLFADRAPFYERYADITVETDGKTLEEAVAAVIAALPPEK